jgi:hypothetical protein
MSVFGQLGARFASRQIGRQNITSFVKARGSGLSNCRSAQASGSFESSTLRSKFIQQFRGREQIRGLKSLRELAVDRRKQG